MTIARRNHVSTFIPSICGKLNQETSDIPNFENVQASYLKLGT